VVGGPLPRCFCGGPAEKKTTAPRARPRPPRLPKNQRESAASGKDELNFFVGVVANTPLGGAANGFGGGPLGVGGWWDNLDRGFSAAGWREAACCSSPREKTGRAPWCFLGRRRHQLARNDQARPGSAFTFFGPRGRGNRQQAKTGRKKPISAICFFFF